MRSFRHYNYRLFFTGQFISLIGTWMQNAAQAWLVYRLSGSAFLLGVVGFISHIPILFLSSLGGVWADKADRRRILVGTQSASLVLALALAALTLSGRIEVWHLLTLAGLLGAVNAVDIPTRQSFIMEMVGREDLPNAIGLNSSMFNAARVAGPAAAGAMIAFVGEGWCFLLNALSFLAVILCLLRMRLTPTLRMTAGGSTLRNILDGFVYAKANCLIRTILLLLGLNSIMGVSYSVLMPLFADQVLHSGPGGFGALMAANGVGAVFGAMRLAASDRGSKLGSWIFFSGVGFGVSVALFSLSKTFWLSTLLLVPVGFFLVAQMSASNTMLQLLAPDAMRGRIMALFSMMCLGMAPFGALLAGWVASLLGAPAMTFGGGLACAVGALTLGWRLRKARLESTSHGEAP